jgi:hypothetical protein
MPVRSRSGSPRTPRGALAGTAAEAADPPAEAPRGTAATDRPAAAPPRRGAAITVNRSNSSSAGTAMEAPARPADTPPGAAAKEPPGTTAETAGPPQGAPPGGANAGWPLGHPLHRGPAAVAALITIALVEKAAADLERTHERTRLSKTDIVNRALSLYEFIDAELGDGAELIVRRDGHDNLLQLL